jgi:tRNA 2-selenouridine synthase
MKSIEAKDFFELSAQYPIIDVRTPAEFEHGHIPGAANIPLFSNEERAEIGILYKQQGREPAMLRGMEIVKPKFTEFVKAAETVIARNEAISSKDTFLVHCWRGGMRSTGMAWLFEWNGWKVYTLKGGYKSFRKMALDTFAMPRNINILGGRTGSGKTLILNELGKLGQPILDLETIACHKGSAFGALGEKPQPTQEMFENELATALLKIPRSETLWVEDESQNVGKRIIPNAFFEQMRSAKVYYADIPLEKRIEYLTEEYGKYTKEELIASIEKIWKRLGPQHAKAAIEALKGGDIKKCCELCLVYYDKSYAHGIAKRQASTIIKKSFAELKPEEIARGIV